MSRTDTIHESGISAAVMQYEDDGSVVSIACRYAGLDSAGPVWEILIATWDTDGATMRQATEYAGIGPEGVDGSEFEHPVTMLRRIASHLAVYALAWAEAESGMGIAPEAGLFVDVAPQDAWIIARAIASEFGLSDED